MTSILDPGPVFHAAITSVLLQMGFGCILQQKQLIFLQKNDKNAEMKKAITSFRMDFQEEY